MTAQSTSGAPAGAPVRGVAWGRRVPGLDRLLQYRLTLLNYGQMLAGTGVRMLVQLGYFFVLAEALSLRDMGVFASVSAAGIMLGCLTGFGFQSAVFRSAAGRRSSLGCYLACYYACAAVSLPVSLLISAVLYAAIFADSLPWPAFLAIILVEVALWRFIEVLSLINNGLGRYAAGAALVTIATGFRAASALAFMVTGGGGVTRWAAFYFLGNAMAAAVLALTYAPRVRLRWRRALLFGRLRANLLYALSYFSFLAQNEVDKVVILYLAGDRMAGLYAIAMRLVDLTAAPLRPLFILYSCKLIAGGRITRRVLRDCLKVEGLVAAVSIVGFVGIVVVLQVWPTLLGRNVALASGLLGLAAMVPAARNLLEFHGELFIAFDRMGLRSLLAVVVVAAKAGMLALTIVAASGEPAWGLWLNAVYVLPYLISFVSVYGLLWRASPPGSVSCPSNATEDHRRC